jgi:oligopeptide/dipeptide ABC transporter ATP-binding protein
VGNLLSVENLETHFRTNDGVVRAVDNVSFVIPEGTTIGLVGESGCGKSVTSLSIMRLIDYPGEVVGGRIMFQDRNLVDLSPEQMRRVRGKDIAMIFQEPMTSLNPVYKVGEQIAEAVRNHMHVDRKTAWKRAIEMLDLVGIPSAARRVDDYPHNMSGGMRQRVMIAMALSCDPKLLIADEPTTALDVTIQAQILDLLRDLQDRLGMSILLITHDLGVVAEMCADVCVMYAGQIVEKADVHKLYSSPQHPYTEGLLHSIPQLGMTQTDKLAVIRGVVPNPLNWPAGCRFAPRCDYRFEKCEKQPPMFEIDSQESACWLCESGRRVAASTAFIASGRATAEPVQRPRASGVTAGDA